MGERQVCARCGQVHAKCTGHKRRKAGTTETAPLLPCGANPMKGKDVCRIHGALSPEGMASPHFKHGRYSKVLAGLNLGAHYEQTRTDPSLMTLGDDIALVSSRIFELIEQMAGGEGPVAWTKALESARAVRDSLLAVHDAMKAPAGPNRGPAIASALKAHEQVVADNVAVTERGASSADTWPLITEQLYVRKNLVDSEVKRQKAGAEVMLKSQALVMVQRLVETVARHVTDRRQLQAVMTDVRQLVMGGPSGS